MLDSAMNIFSYTWATSAVDSSVAHNKSCCDWDCFEYLDIISTLAWVLPQENFIVNDRFSASLTDWTTLCSEKNMKFFSRNSRDYQVVCSSGNLGVHEQRPSLTVAWSGSNNSYYMVWKLVLRCGKRQFSFTQMLPSKIDLNVIKVKVKCTLEQALRLSTGCTAHRGSRIIALPFLDHGTRRGWGVSVTPRPLFTPGKDPVPIVQEAG